MARMKGQTAMEYLMTYGWAILIVIVVGAVLFYYGVFSPGRLVGPSATGFSSITPVSPWDFSSGGALRLVLENRVGGDITVTSVGARNVGSAGAFAGTLSPPNATISAGGRSSTLTLSGTGSTGNAGDAFNIEVNITYSSSTIGVVSTIGRLSGTRS